jgi:hypothetical protein
MKAISKPSRRFLAPKPKGKPIRADLTHDQIAHAIRTFQGKGGLIKKLPPQGGDSRTNVGRMWDVAYESLFEHW